MEHTQDGPDRSYRIGDVPLGNPEKLLLVGSFSERYPISVLSHALEVTGRRTAGRISLGGE